MAEVFLITGGCGFAGSAIAIHLKNDFPTSRVIVFDNLKRRGSELNIIRLKEMNIEFIHGDIRNKEDFDSIGPVTYLIEAAAEPSVLAGMDNTPDYVINTNLNGTLNCLNYARKFNAKFIFLSTSRVYPINNLSEINYKENETRFVIEKEQVLPGVSENGISEKFPLDGARSFYGSSKLSSELFIQEYNEFYGLKTIINRCGVLTGPWQMGKVDQGVIVLWVARHFWKKELNYIGFGGTGKQVRDILHIDDLYSLLKIQMKDFDSYNGKIFNVGGGNAMSVSLLELTNICERVTGNKIRINAIDENRTADIPVYITDNGYIQQFTNWSPKISSEDIIIDVFEWLRKNEKQVEHILK